MSLANPFSVFFFILVSALPSVESLELKTKDLLVAKQSIVQDDIIIKCRLFGHDPSTCKIMQKQISHESRFAIWAIGDGGCSWGLVQYNTCVHLGLATSDARYIARVLSPHYDIKITNKALARIEAKYGVYFTQKWQIWYMNTQYHKRGRKCNPDKANYYKDLTRQQYCQIRYHNWNGGNNYVNKVRRALVF